MQQHQAVLRLLLATALLPVLWAQFPTYPTAPYCTPWEPSFIPLCDPYIPGTFPLPGPVCLLARSDSVPFFFL